MAALLDSADIRPEAAFDELALRLDAALDAESELELRRLFTDIVGRRFRAASGLRVLLSVEALRACAQDAASDRHADESKVEISPERYERWRARQQLPWEWPSRRFILRCFDDSWVAGLDAAGLPVSRERRARQQRMTKRENFTRGELLTALRSWLADGGAEHDSFTAYRAWALKQLAEGRMERLAISAPTFRSAFGSWASASAVALASGEADCYGRGRVLDERRAYRREHLLDQLRRAMAQTHLGAGMTRRAHDDWVRDGGAARLGLPGALSETMRRRFGSWNDALAAAGFVAGSRVRPIRNGDSRAASPPPRIPAPCWQRRRVVRRLVQAK